MKSNQIISAALVTAGLSFGGVAQAANVTPNIIFGGGNVNGSFTLGTATFAGNDIELGLRAKLRYDENGQPQNVFNWDNNSSYAFDLANGNPDPGRAMWNYEWSIDVTDTGQTITDLQSIGGSALLEVDIDPTAATNFVGGDPLAGNAYYGTRATPNGASTESATTPAGVTVAQQSGNYGFFGGPLGAGTYDLRLSVLNASGGTLGSTEITVNVAPVPVPAALPLLAAGIGGLAWVGRRKRRAATA